MITIGLSSCTVFWTELGLPGRPTSSQQVQLGIWWAEFVLPWIKVAVKHDYNPYENGVWFANRHDAALFKIRFMGDIPNLL